MEASDASKKSLTAAVMQTYACFNVFLKENIASYRCFRGVVQVFVRAIGGKRGSRWILQRGALRGPATPRSPAARAARGPRRAPPAGHWRRASRARPPRSPGPPPPPRKPRAHT